LEDGERNAIIPGSTNQGRCPGLRPQRGLHDAHGPLGRAFLKPRPMAVVDYSAHDRSWDTVVTAKPQRPPKFRIHKFTQQACVELSGRRFYLGLHHTPEARQRYNALVADWLANGRQLRVSPQEVTVKELIARYWLFAEKYYRDPDGNVSRELDNIRDALRPVKELYGETLAKDFGPRALRAVREKMIGTLCRRNVNCRIGRIKRVFRWSASEEHISGEVYHALLSVDGLWRGRSEARESEPVRPVTDEDVQAIRPFVSRQIWAMIELQRLTGARAGEIVIMRPVTTVNRVIGKSSPARSARASSASFLSFVAFAPVNGRSAGRFCMSAPSVPNGLVIR